MNLDGIELNDSFGLNPSASEFVPSTPPHFLPRNSTPGVTAASITPLDAVWKSPSKPSNPQSNKKLIKFVNNVHFPKDFLNKCLRVLPPDVSLADVKYQPENFQEKWFDYLKQRQSKTVEEPKTANDKDKKPLLLDNFAEDERIKKSHKVATVSKFVSSMTEVDANDEDKKSLLHNNFVEDERSKKSHKVPTVSKFVSSMTEVDANDEDKKSLLHNNFAEDERSKKSHKVPTVSKFVSSMTEVDLDDRINKIFEDLSFLCDDYKEELTTSSIED